MLFQYAGHFEPDPDGGFLVTFPDVPEAITAGDNLVEARRNAVEALGMALRGYVAAGRPLPSNKATGKGLMAIAVEPGDALKLAVIEAFNASGLSKVEFADRLGKVETEARRILDPDHPTKLTTLETALAIFGKQIVVSVLDAA